MPETEGRNLENLDLTQAAILEDKKRSDVIAGKSQAQAEDPLLGRSPTDALFDLYAFSYYHYKLMSQPDKDNQFNSIRETILKALSGWEPIAAFAEQVGLEPSAIKDEVKGLFS